MHGGGAEDEIEQAEVGQVPDFVKRPVGADGSCGIHLKASVTGRAARGTTERELGS